MRWRRHIPQWVHALSMGCYGIVLGSILSMIIMTFGSEEQPQRFWMVCLVMMLAGVGGAGTIEIWTKSDSFDR